MCLCSIIYLPFAYSKHRQKTVCSLSVIAWLLVFDISLFWKAQKAIMHQPIMMIRIQSGELQPDVFVFICAAPIFYSAITLLRYSVSFHGPLLRQCTRHILKTGSPVKWMMSNPGAHTTIIPLGSSPWENWFSKFHKMLRFCSTQDLLEKDHHRLRRRHQSWWGKQEVELM